MSIDTLTGEYVVERTDILHDVGRSLNPAIDIGQIEGGFIQGMGWLTTEELWWDDKGRLRTHAPSTYKIPLASDRPKHFSVKLADWAENAEPTVHRSKAVGEPPFMHGMSVFHALADAVASVADHRISPNLDAPATPERVLMAVERLRRETGGVSPSSLSGRTRTARAGDGRRAAPVSDRPTRHDPGRGRRGQGIDPTRTRRMDVVAPDALFGTIGGGQLEFLAIDRARALLKSGGAGDAIDLPLGPEIGQCCGGRVGLSLRQVDTDLRDALVARVIDEDAARPAVFLFGGGHVGAALSASLSLLPLAVHVVETRAEALEAIPSPVATHLSAVPEEWVSRAPARSAFVVLTHDHALDFSSSRQRSRDRTPPMSV